MSETVDVLIGIGSNIDSERNVPGALQRIRDEFEVVGVSTMYTSAPVGRVDQPEFINGVVHLQTALAPRDLKKQLLEIEAALGRVRDPNDKCGPRTIDLDIVLFGQLIDVDLQIPDPNMSVRWFVAIPAAELIPNWKHPESGELLSQIAAEMEDSIDGAPIDLQGISQ